MFLRRLRSDLIVVALAAVAAACGGEGGGSATLKGSVADGVGTQQQGLDSFGGSGTAAATSKVKVSSVGNGGALTAVGEAQITAGGSYSIDVPSGQQKLIIQAVDASGSVIASAIVETTGSAGGTITIPPMDSETSVEASIFVEMIAQGTAIADANVIDLRARINSKVAETVKASANSKAKIKLLAESTVAAQKTQIKAFAQMGVTTTQQALFEASVAGAQKLNAALDANATASAQAYADFYAAIQAAQQSVGASAKQQAQAESCAGLSFRATAETRTGVTGDAVLDAAIRSSATLEGRMSTAAVEASFKAASASVAAMDKMTQASASLRSSLSTATTAAAVAQAYASYSAAITGGANVSNSALGAMVEVSALDKTKLQDAVDASVSAAATLDTALNTALTANITLTGNLNAQALADAVVQAYSTYATSAQAQATALAAFGTKAQPALDVLLVINASFHLGN